MAHLAPSHDTSSNAHAALGAAQLAALERPGVGDWALSSQELRQGAFVSELEDGLGEFDACWLN
jgi:hypothetical protein